MRNLFKILTLAALSNAYALETQFTVGGGTGFMVLSGVMTSPNLASGCNLDEKAGNGDLIGAGKCLTENNRSVGTSGNAKLEFNGFIFLGTEVEISDSVKVNANVQINSAKFTSHYLRGARATNADDGHAVSIYQTINPRYGFNANILATIPGSSFSVGPAFQYLRSSLISNGVVIAKVDGAVDKIHKLTKEANSEYQSKVAIGLIFAAKVSEHFSLEMTLSSMQYSPLALRFDKAGVALKDHLGASSNATTEVALDRKQKLANASIGLKYTF